MFLLDPLQCGNNGGGQVKQLGWVAMDLSYYKIASPTANHTHRCRVIVYRLPSIGGVGP